MLKITVGIDIRNNCENRLLKITVGIDIRNNCENRC